MPGSHHLTVGTCFPDTCRTPELPACEPMNTLRKRDLLLSLKYATIEASFSVPMLNLTLTQFPFAVGFAVTALGWRSGAIGGLAAIPRRTGLLSTG